MRYWSQACDGVLKLGYKISAWKASHAEQRNIAIRHQRLPPKAETFIHLLSLATTGIVLSLSFEKKVFAGPDDPHLSSKLNAMQFVAAVHAIILTMSLSSIATWIACYGMCFGRDMPFGLLTTLYQLSSPEQIFSRAVWSRKPSKSRIDPRQCGMRIGIIIAILLTALLGPSSAVLLVPQIGWSHVSHALLPFGLSASKNGPISSFIPADYNSLYPSNVDQAYVNVHCDPLGEACPNAGMQSISQWCTQWYSNREVPNLTVSALQPVVRPLIASYPGPEPTGWSAASVPMLNLSRLMNRLWFWCAQSGSTVSTKVSNPRIEFKFNKENPVMQPFVQVQCSSPVNITYGETLPLSFEYDRLVDVAQSTSSPINMTVESTDWTARRGAQVEFLNLADPNVSLLGAIIGLTFSSDSEESSTHRLLFPCTIDASWTPTTLGFQPLMSKMMFSNISDPGASDHNGHASRERISIDASYANALNSVIEDSTHTLANESYTVVEWELRYFYNNDNATAVYDVFSESEWLWTFATTLSLQIADALSRINAYVDGIVWINETQTAWNFATMVDYNSWARQYRESIFTSPYAARHEPESFTEIKWNVEQYVYSWNFRQTPSYLALAVIAVHSFVVICYLGTMWLVKWKCKAGASILDLLVLTLQSPSSEVMKGTSTGIRSNNQLTACVRMVESDDGEKVVLSVGDGDKIGLDTQQLVPGKTYK